MTIVAGVDFGTTSVRVSIFHSERGRLGIGTAAYPVLRRPDDANFATQRPDDQALALQQAFAAAIAAAGVPGKSIAALAVDTTGSTVIPVDAGLRPLDDYALWCDHRAWREAAEITASARARKLAALDWCGGAYSSEWGFSKVLHWLRERWNIAISSWRSSPAFEILPVCDDRCAPWATNGFGTGRSAVCPPMSS